MFAYSALSRLNLWCSVRLRQVVEAVAAAEVGDRRAAHRLACAVDEAADLLEQLVCRSCRSPPTVAAATYMRVYQLIWFSRSVGHCQNSPLTVG